jgi:hypothetical protein
MQSKLISLLTTVSFIAGVLMIIVGCPTLVLLDKTTAAFAILIAGVVAVLVGRLHHVEELTLGPLKARLRKSIDEANATIQQLRSLALALGEASLTDLMAGNFFEGMSLRRRFATHDVIKRSLLDLGLSVGDIQKASANWNKGIAVTYHRAIRAALPKELNVRIRDEFNGMLKFEEWQAPSPDALDAFLRQHGLVTDEVTAWIDDYRHFERTKEIRRLDEFVKQ